MLGDLVSLVQDALGLGSEDLNTGQMLLRTLLVFPLAIFTVRLGDKRFLGELSALDLVVAIMLGSILSRAISGNAPFLASLAAGLGLVLLHRVFARAGVRYERLGNWVKGRERLLVENGDVRWGEMKAAGIGEADLMAALRRKAHLTTLRDVKLAYLERTGDISVIPREEASG